MNKQDFEKVDLRPNKNYSMVSVKDGIKAIEQRNKKFRKLAGNKTFMQRYSVDI